MMNKLSSPPHSTAGSSAAADLRRSANESAPIQSVTVPGGSACALMASITGADGAP